MKLNAIIPPVLLLALTLLAGCPGKKDGVPTTGTPKPPAATMPKTLHGEMQGIAERLGESLQKQDTEGFLNTLIESTQKLIKQFPNQPDAYDLILNGARIQLPNTNNTLRLLDTIEQPLSQSANSSNGAPYLDRLEVLHRLKLEWASHHIEHDPAGARKIIQEAVKTVPNINGILDNLFTLANQHLLRGQRALLLANHFEEQISQPPSPTFTTEHQMEQRNNLHLLRLNWANQNLHHPKSVPLIDAILKNTRKLSDETTAYFQPVLKLLDDKALATEESRDLEDWFAAASAMTHFYGRLQVRNKALGLRRRLDTINQPLALKITTLDGKTFDLAQQRGKVVLIDFWDSRNRFSLNAVKRLRAAYHKLRDKGLAIISIAHDNDPEILNQAVTGLKIDWPVAFGNGGKNPFSRRYAITALPTQWLVDRQGRLRNLDTWIKPTNEDWRRYDIDKNSQLSNQEALALESELRQRLIQMIEPLLAEPTPK